MFSCLYEAIPEGLDGNDGETRISIATARVSDRTGMPLNVSRIHELGNEMLTVEELKPCRIKHLLVDHRRGNVSWVHSSRQTKGGSFDVVLRQVLPENRYVRQPRSVIYGPLLSPSP